MDWSSGPLASPAKDAKAEVTLAALRPSVRRGALFETSSSSEHFSARENTDQRPCVWESKDVTQRE
jgi:hypothetical protein